MFRGFPAKTSFCLVPRRPRRRTSRVLWSTPIPTFSAWLVDASFLNRGSIARSICVFIVIAQAAAASTESLPLISPNIPSPWISTYPAPKRSRITVIALMK